MREHLFALLIHHQSEPFESLRQTLRDLGVETYSVDSCQAAERIIPQCKPHIIFTESSLTDGSWLSIINIGETSAVPLSVIVVGIAPDTRFYLSVMERGAFDFVVPPFEHEPLNFVIRSAARETHRRREALAHAFQA